MNAEALRREIFELMFQRDGADDGSQIVQLRFAIRQYYAWIVEPGHGTDETGADL